MKDWIPKVGDLVTPDPYFAKDAVLIKSVGQIFTVTEVDEERNDMSIDRYIDNINPHNWYCWAFMPAKNQIVINILNDL